jgi:hypothetical protein
MRNKRESKGEREKRKGKRYPKGATNEALNFLFGDKSR